MINLLRRADGATIVDLTEATGWLAHTTRAAITGLRKRGYAVTRERIGAGESVYRISGAPAGSGDRVPVQTEAVDRRRDPKPKTKRAAHGPHVAASFEARRLALAAAHVTPKQVGVDKQGRRGARPRHLLLHSAPRTSRSTSGAFAEEARNAIAQPVSIPRRAADRAC